MTMFDLTRLLLFVFALISFANCISLVPQDGERSGRAFWRGIYLVGFAAILTQIGEGHGWN